MTQLPPHDPQTGEIPQSDREHDAPVVHEPVEDSADETSTPVQESAEALDAPQSAPAGAASDKAPALVTPVPAPPEGADGHPQPSPEADEQSVDADGGQGGESPGIETAHFGQEPVSAAQGGNPAASASEASVIHFDNPRCQHPNTCSYAHSRTTCVDCLLAWSERPKDEQIRLWQEAIAASQESEAA